MEPCPLELMERESTPPRKTHVIYQMHSQPFRRRFSIAKVKDPKCSLVAEGRTGPRRLRKGEQLRTFWQPGVAHKAVKHHDDHEFLTSLIC